FVFGLHSAINTQESRSPAQHNVIGFHRNDQFLGEDTSENDRQPLFSQTLPMQYGTGSKGLSRGRLGGYSGTEG
ncbi:hypothetical protein JMJ77_0005188, partial [Colletotrichum scovillei]